MANTVTTQRSYTLSEIDHMRKAIEWGIIPPGQCYYPADKTAQVEDRLRTYLASGIEPEEVVKMYLPNIQN